MVGLRKVKSSEGSLSGLAFGTNWVPAFGKLRKSASSGANLSKGRQPDDDIWGDAEVLTLEPNLDPKAQPWEHPPTSPRVLHQPTGARGGNEVRAVYTLIGESKGGDRQPPKAAGPASDAHAAAAPKSRRPLASILESGESASPGRVNGERCDIMRSAPELSPGALCKALAIGSGSPPPGEEPRPGPNGRPPATKINLEMREMPRSLRKALMMSEPVSDHFSDATGEDWAVSEEGDVEWDLASVTTSEDWRSSAAASRTGGLDTVLVHASRSQYSGELCSGDSLAGMSMSRDADRPFPDDDLSSEFAFPQPFFSFAQAPGAARADPSPFYGVDSTPAPEPHPDLVCKPAPAVGLPAHAAADTSPFYGVDDAALAEGLQTGRPAATGGQAARGAPEASAFHRTDGPARFRRQQSFGGGSVRDERIEVRDSARGVNSRVGRVGARGWDGGYESEGEGSDIGEDGESMYEPAGLQDDDQVDVCDVFLPEVDDVTYPEESNQDPCQRPQVFPPDELGYEFSSDEAGDGGLGAPWGGRSGRVGGDEESTYSSKPLQSDVYESDRCRGSFDSDEGPMVDTAFGSTTTPDRPKMWKKRGRHSGINNEKGYMYDTAHTVVEEARSKSGPPQAAWMFESSTNEYVETLPARCSPSPTVVCHRNMPTTSSADIWLTHASVAWSPDRDPHTGRVKCFEPSAIIGAIIRRFTGRCTKRPTGSPEPRPGPPLDFEITEGWPSEDADDLGRREPQRHGRRQTTMLRVVEERVEESDDCGQQWAVSDVQPRTYDWPGGRQGAQPSTARSVNKTGPGSFHRDYRCANGHADVGRKHGYEYQYRIAPSGSEGSRIESYPGPECGYVQSRDPYLVG